MYNDPNAQPPYGQSPYTSPYEQQYAPQTQPPQYPPTQYGTPPAYPPPVYAPVQQPKQSNKVLWIVLGIIGALLLIVGGGCCAVFYFVGKTAQNTVQTLSTQVSTTMTADQGTMIADETPPAQQAQDYYLAISAQDYSNAYSYLAPNMTASDGTALTQATFTQQAQALDASEGDVTDYTATADPNDATKVTVQVTRSKGKTYTVHLTFKQGDYQWVISSFDSI